MTIVSIYFFQVQIIPNREDQWASFEPLVDHLEKGPPSHSKPRLSGLVIGGPKRYKNHGHSDPKRNACYEPTSEMTKTRFQV